MNKKNRFFLPFKHKQSGFNTYYTGRNTVLYSVISVKGILWGFAVIVKMTVKIWRQP